MPLDTDKLYSINIDELTMVWHACGGLSTPGDSQIWLYFGNSWETVAQF